MVWIPKGQLAVATDPTTAQLIGSPSLTQTAVDGRIGDVAADIIASDPTIKTAATEAIDEAIDSGGLDSRWYAQFVGAKNLITNGRFQSAMTGWSLLGATAAVAGGVCTLTGTGATGSVAAYTAPSFRFTAVTGHVMFFRGRVRARSTGTTALRLWMSDATTNEYLNGVQNNVPAPAQDVWHDISGTITIPAGWNGKTIQSYLGGVHSSAAVANGKIIEVTRAVVLDLTAMYGAGMEPSPAEIEALIKTLPNEYIDGEVPQFERNRMVVTRDQIPTLVPTARRRGSGAFVVFRFDDGFVSNLELAAPYMAARGMIGYVGMCTRLVDTVRPGGRIMNAAELVQLESMGWEVGSHTTHHDDAIANPALFIESLDNSIRDLVSWGVPYPDTFTYPNGSRTAASDREVYRRFSKAQLTGYPNLTPTKVDEPVFFTGWTVITGNAPESTKELQFQRLQAYVRESFRQGRCPVLGFHSITPGTPDAAHNLDFAMFKRIVDWVAAEGYPVGLPRDMRPHNQVADPGFNEYPILRWASGTAFPWAFDENGGWERVTAGHSTGLAAARLASSTPSDRFIQQGLALEPGVHRVHVYASVPSRTDGAIQVRLQPVNMFDGNLGASQLAFELNATTAGFIDFTGTITVPDGAPVTRLTIGGVGFVGEVLIDHVAVFPTTLYDPLA